MNTVICEYCGRHFIPSCVEEAAMATCSNDCFQAWCVGLTHRNERIQQSARATLSYVEAMMKPRLTFKSSLQAQWDHVAATELPF